MSRLQRSAGSFERASQRKADHLTLEKISKHLSAAEVNHKERCGRELEHAEVLRDLVKASMEGGEVQISSPHAPDLERLALIEGHLDHLRTQCPMPNDEAHKALDERLSSVNLRVSAAARAGRVSVMDALHAAVGAPESRDFATRIALKLQSLVQEQECVTFGGVDIRDLVTWGRLPDECLAVDGETPPWGALIAYIRDSEGLEQVGADWLILALASLVLGQRILVYSATFNVSVRFAPEDTKAGGFVPCAELPPGEDWIRLAMCDGQGFVPLENVPVPAEGLLQKLREMHAAMDEQISACVSRRR